MTTVIRINLLYSVANSSNHIAGPDVTLYRMRVSNTFTVNVIFCPLKQILGDLKTNLAIEMSQNNTLTNGKL